MSFFVLKLVYLIFHAMSITFAPVVSLVFCFVLFLFVCLFKNLIDIQSAMSMFYSVVTVSLLCVYVHL